jgi:hypothetical protein
MLSAGLPAEGKKVSCPTFRSTMAYIKEEKQYGKTQKKKSS